MQPSSPTSLETLSCNADVMENITMQLITLETLSALDTLSALHRTCRQVRHAMDVAKPHCYARFRADKHLPPFAVLVWLLAPRVTSWQATVLLCDFRASACTGGALSDDPRGLATVLRKAAPLPRWETLAIVLIDQRCPRLLGVLCAHMGRNEAIGPLVQRCMYPKIAIECVKVLADACFARVLCTRPIRREPDMLQLQGVMQLVTMQQPKGKLAQAVSFVFLHVLDDGMRGVPGHYRRAMRLLRPHLGCCMHDQASVLVTETMRLLRSVAPACEW